MHDAMLSNERMDEVKQYGDYVHGRVYVSANEKHIEYVIEVITWYCEHGKIQEAKAFANQQVGWFKRNVDATEDPRYSTYKSYNSKVMKDLFTKTIASYE